MIGVPDPHTVAVLDVGKSNVKIVLVDVRGSREIWTRTMPNHVRTDGPYPHVDTAAIEAFILDGLADIAAKLGGCLDAVSITTHGAAGALIGPGELTLPIMDYEFDGPDADAEAYGRLRPDFDETFSPRLRGGLNLGAQLFWQERRFPGEFARACRFVTYAQYWAWRLTAVAATERTSLGCHTDLWAPHRDEFSSLVERMGWLPKMAPVRSAFDVLGMMHDELTKRAGFRRSVRVLCGIHDSNASLLAHLRDDAEPLSIISTGTWLVAFAVNGSLKQLDASRDCLANVDAYGRPTPSARFMGGREFDILTEGQATEPDAVAIASVIERCIMALPTFAPGNGPFPSSRGRWTHDPDTLTAPERTAVAGLYLALMTRECLDLLGATGPIIVEGPFGRNVLFCDALSILVQRPLAKSPDLSGTSAGAARLAVGRQQPRPLAYEATPIHPQYAQLTAYAEQWRRRAYAMS